MIPLVGLILGIVLGVSLDVQLPDVLAAYVPIAVVAGLDSAFGGLRAFLDHVYSDKVFIVSFLSNVAIGVGLVYVGDLLGVGQQLSTAILVVFGIRIFTNASAIRRHFFHA